MKTLFATFLLLLLAYQPQDRITNALKAVQKGEFEKARGMLEKQREKTPEAAGLAHVWAHYFFAEKNKQFSPDSAYWFVQQAIRYYPTANPKDAKEWAEDSLDLANAKTLKARIEAFAFRTASQDAQQQDNVLPLESFLGKFPQAPQIPAATSLRNDIAWKQAERANTIEAYQSFLLKYPQTAYQQMAIEKRDRLILQRETKQGTMLAYQQFIKAYTNKNLYVDEAVEALFPLYTTDFSVKSFSEFWGQYKAFPAARKAWYQLFQIYKNQHQLDVFEREFSHPVYSKEYQLAQWEELQKYAVFPFFEKELYGYLNEAGKPIVAAELENIPAKHICQAQKNNYLITQQNTHFGLRSLVGKQVFPAEYDAFLMLAPAVWRVNKNGFFGVMHEEGKIILPLRYDAIEMLGANLLKFKKNRRWGVANLHGQILLEPTFFEIDLKQNALLVARQASGFALYKVKDFWRQVQEKNLPTPFEAEQITVLDSVYFQFKKKEQLGILNTRLEVVLPAQSQEIKYLPQTAFARRKDSLSWHIFSLNGVRIMQEEHFQKVEGGNGFLLLKKGKHWGVLQASNAQLRHSFELDSVALADKVLFLYKEKGKKVLVDFIEGEKPLEAQGFRNMRVENGYLFFENAQQQKGLYDMKGKRVCAPMYQSIYPLTPLLFNVQASGKYGIVDTVGKAVLPLKYDGIDAQEDNYTLILNGKYGLYNPALKLTTETQYDQVPQILNFSPTTRAIMGAKNGLKGLVDLHNKSLIPFQYEEVLAWQDSVAIVQTQKGEWLFYNFARKGKEKIKEKDREKAHTTPTHFQEIKLLATQGYTVILQVKQEELWGIWDNQKGERVKPNFQHIENKGAPQMPFYFADKKLPNHHYLVAYINAHGEKIWEKELSEQDYERLICE